MLNQTDEQVNELISKDEISKKLKELSRRRMHYNNLRAELNKSKEQGENQISTIDQNARLFTSQGSKGHVAFNLQSVVDSKNKLIVHNEITNRLDTNALYEVSSKAKQLLQVDQINVLADTGYDTGEDLRKCAADNIAIFVSPRIQKGGSKGNGFTKKDFKYDKQTDIYTCPEGELLRTNSKVYTQERKGRKGRKDATFKEYKAEYEVYKSCANKEQCAAKRLNRKQGRVIQRYMTADYTEANQQRIKNNKDYYRQGQSIVEHPFGTIKRQWGYSYILLK